jgi:hypothetical protein
MLWQPHTWTPWYLSYWREYIFHCATAPSGQRPPQYRRCTITLRHTTTSRSSLDEKSARCSHIRDSTQHSQETGIRAPGGTRNHNPSKRAAVDLRLTPRGHWDRHRWLGCRREQQPWTKSDIPLARLESYLLFSWTGTDMILLAFVWPWTTSDIPKQQRRYGDLLGVHRNRQTGTPTPFAHKQYYATLFLTGHPFLTKMRK